MIKYLFINLMINAGSTTIEVSQDYIVDCLFYHDINLKTCLYIERKTGRMCRIVNGSKTYEMYPNLNEIKWTTEAEETIINTISKQHPLYGTILEIYTDRKFKSFLNDEFHKSSIKYSCLSGEHPLIKKYLINSNGQFEWRTSITNKIDHYDTFPYVYKDEIIHKDMNVINYEIVKMEERTYSTYELKIIENIFADFKIKVSE